MIAGIWRRYWVVIGGPVVGAGYWSLAWAATRALQEPHAVEAATVGVWAIASATLATLGLTIGLWRWITIALRDIKNEQVEIDSALRGYKGSGGLVEQVAALRREVATVDERITQSRHDVRNDLSHDILKLEADGLLRSQEFEQRINQRISDLGLRARTQNFGGQP